jgi:hypothetical protein
MICPPGQNTIVSGNKNAEKQRCQHRGSGLNAVGADVGFEGRQCARAVDLQLMARSLLPR